MKKITFKTFSKYCACRNYNHENITGHKHCMHSKIMRSIKWEYQTLADDYGVWRPTRVQVIDNFCVKNKCPIWKGLRNG